jgi:ABC-2 type transport system permease protein
VNLIATAFRLELRHLFSDRLYVALTVLAAASFLALTSLFGLTASDAPMALIVHDRGPYARPFVASLVEVPHAFRLARMTPERAEERLRRGDLVGAIIIPEDFSATIAAGGTAVLGVEVDNVNMDIVTDVQRSLPSAIVSFGHKTGLPGLRVQLDEHDVWPSDTSFLPYITVSGLALAGLIVASVLGALAITRELEARTLLVLRLAPASLARVLAGKIGAATLVALGALGSAAVIVIAGYGVVPVHPIAAIVGLIACTGASACLGAWLGATTRKTATIVPLLFGLAMPLFIDSGALEPTRFDGETVWWASHATPLYYVVGWFQWAFFGLRITPEPPWVNLAITLGVALAAFALAQRRISTLRLERAR